MRPHRFHIPSIPPTSYARALIARPACCATCGHTKRGCNAAPCVCRRTRQPRSGEGGRKPAGVSSWAAAHVTTGMDAKPRIRDAGCALGVSRPMCQRGHPLPNRRSSTPLRQADHFTVSSLKQLTKANPWRSSTEGSRRAVADVPRGAKHLQRVQVQRQQMVVPEAVWPQEMRAVGRFVGATLEALSPAVPRASPRPGVTLTAGGTRPVP